MIRRHESRSGVYVLETELWLPRRIDDVFAFFSNFGADVDLAAPGVCVGSTFPGGQAALDSGTSLAAPMVAVAAPLSVSVEPAPVSVTMPVFCWAVVAMLRPVPTTSAPL